LLIERDNRKIPVARQAELLGTFRSTVYYKPVVDEYPEHLFMGSRRMREMLRRKGYRVNRKRVQRLVHLMGIEAIYPKISQDLPLATRYTRIFSGTRKYRKLVRCGALISPTSG